MSLPPPRRREMAHVAISVAAIALLVTLLRLIRISNPTTVALSLLVIVLWTATASHLWVAVVASVVAMLALNFFFMPPVGTFTIADPQNWVALAVFLIVGVVASTLSTSARTRAQEALDRRRDADLIRQKVDLASTLLASLSHDLRTPLTAITVAVENLQQPQLAAGERQAQARAALTELARLTRLFRDILDMARIDAAALTVERDWVTPADIVDAAVAYLRPALDQRTLAIDADSATEVFVDPRLTSAALSHVLANAAHYSPADRPIDIHGRANAEGLRLIVRDHGSGLDPSEIGHLFERFFRGSRAGRQVLGTGLGLAITRGLLAAEDGAVRGDNARGGGAEFTLFVPGPSRPLASEVTA